ncbi:unnamed protein product [Sphagnum compactum]
MEKNKNNKLVILYATQTGNAQDVAERMGREARRHHLQPLVVSMHAYNPSSLPGERYVLFVVSTTGQGDPPDSMRGFWKFLLRKSLGHQWLAGTQFAVFGLGDSGYQKYNVVAKKLDRRLLDLGGKPLLVKGLGDDQHPFGFEAGLDPWLASLWVTLREQIPLPVGLQDPTPGDTGLGFLPSPPVSITEFYLLARAMVDAASNPYVELATSDHNNSSIQHGAPSMPVFAQLLKNQRLTKDDHDQDVRHIELDLGNSGAQYVPGDILTLLPRQNPTSVEKFLKRCGLDPDAYITVEAADSATSAADEKGDVPKRQPILVKTLVEAVMDVDSASPRRYLFEVMSHFAGAEHERERLVYFATPEGRDDLYRYNQRERRTVLEVLNDFPSVQLPLEWLLQTVPRLQPRSFSIASSQKAHPNEAHITVAVVKWATPFKRERHGLCSSWLASLNPNQGKIFVPIWFTNGAIKLPPPSVPLILVGPGTGCAPFHAFVEERVTILSRGDTVVAPVLLFFGCRKQAKDFLYEEDWLAWSTGKNVLSNNVGGGFFVAFSRDQSEKVYVQHKICEQGENVWQMLQSGGAVFVAGSATKMPSDVMSAFERAIAKETGWPNKTASQYVKELEQKGRYTVEAWS